MQAFLPTLPEIQRKRRIISLNNDDSDSEEMQTISPSVPIERLAPVGESSTPPVPKARRGRLRKIRNVETTPGDISGGAPVREGISGPAENTTTESAETTFIPLAPDNVPVAPSNTNDAQVVDEVVLALQYVSRN